MRCLALLAVLALPFSAPAFAATALPEWMAGTWAMESGAAWADEVWTSPRGGMMLGIYRLGFGGKAEEWHTARIEPKGGGLVLIIQDKGGAASVEFQLAVFGASSIEFTNPANAFPQRIRFWREGQLLMSESARMDGGEARRMNFRPVETAPRD
jgi:hypothetical protein